MVELGIPEDGVNSPHSGMAEDITQAMDKKLDLLVLLPMKGPMVGQFLRLLESKARAKRVKPIFICPPKDIARIHSELTTPGNVNGRKGSVAAFNGADLVCSADSRLVDPSDITHHCTNPQRAEACRFLSSFDLESYRELRDSGGSLLSDKAGELRGKGMCAARLALDLAADSDALVTDHSFLFSEGSEGVLGYLEKDPSSLMPVICDPAALVDYLRARFTYTFTAEDLDPAVWELQVLKESEMKAFTVLLSSMAEVLEGSDGKEQIERKELIDRFVRKCSEKGIPVGMGNLLGAIKSALAEADFTSIGTRLRFKDMYMFLKLWMNQYTGVSRVRFEKDGIKCIALSLVDLSVAASPVLSRFPTTIMFGDTLFPQQIYTSILGMRQDRSMFRSYVDKGTIRGTYVVSLGNVDTSFNHRDEEQYRRIVRNFERISKTVHGLKLAIFPSYSIMDCVLAMVPGSGLTTPVLNEARGMGREERQALLERLREGGDVLAFLVQNSLLTRAVEDGTLHPESVIMVGLQIPPPSPDSNQMKLHLQKKLGPEGGQVISVLLPAITRVMKVINSMTYASGDKGNLVVLMDKRYQDRRVLQCLPRYYDIKLLDNESEFSGERYLQPKGA